MKHHVKKTVNFLGVVLIAICISCSNGDTPTEEMEMQTMQVPDPDSVEEEIGLTGEFVTAAHPTSGTATVNGNHTKLELTNFKTDDGPLLEFYLATDLTASNYISLGMLKGLDGNYTYDLPNNINFGTYKYLMVWCVDFKVNFGHAILE